MKTNDTSDLMWETDAPSEKTPMRPEPVREVLWFIDVLVVDDDPADSWLISRALHGDPRVRHVLSTDKPDEVLLQLCKGDLRPNLILLDVNMPKVNGFKFIDALREIPSLARTPVVMLTTSHLASDVFKARSKSARGYLLKPGSFEELRERLSGIVSQVMKEWSQ